jgi:hypothetical protein
MTRAASVIRFALVVAGLLLSGIAPPARAGNVTYTYTGNNFALVGNSLIPENNSDFITASFTYSQPLICLPGNCPSDTLIGWTVSDGVYNFGSASAGTLSTFALQTDASGNIQDWVFQILAVDCSANCLYPNNIAVTSSNNSPLGNPGSKDYVSYFGNSGLPGCFGANQYCTDNVGTPGLWVETGASFTPEPTTTALVCTGGLLMYFVARRKRSLATFHIAYPRP